MDLNSINNKAIEASNIKINAQKGNSCAKNAPETQENLTAKTSCNPKYWQAQQGVNFCGFFNKNKEKKDNKLANFIDKHTARLHYHKLMFGFYYRDIHKENLKKLIPMGCKAMDRYDRQISAYTLVSPANKHDITNEEFTQKHILGGDMIDFAPELIWANKEYVLDILAYNNDKDVPVNRFDAKREIFQNVIKNKDASSEEKIWWLKHSVIKNVFALDSLDNYKEETVKNFEKYIKTDDEIEKLIIFLKDFDIQDEIIEKAKTLILEGKISANDVIAIIDFTDEKDFCDDNLNKNLDEIFNTIDKKPELCEYLHNLIEFSKTESGYYADGAVLGPKILKEELNKDKDRVHFNNKIVNYILDNKAKETLFENDEDYLSFINSINEDNFQEFKNLIEDNGLKLGHAINVVRFCKDKKGKFKLYPGQKEALSKFLNDKIAYKYKKALPAISQKYIKEDNNGAKYFDEKGFNDITEAFAYDMKFFVLAEELNEENFANLLTEEDFGINQASLRTVFRICDTISNIKESINTPDYQEKYGFLDKALSDIDFRLNESNIFLPVEEKNIKTFSKQILSSKDNALSDFEKTMANSIPLLKTFDDGLPLEYSREEFLSDLSKLCDSKEKREILSSKTGIKLITKEDGHIKGYEGIILFDNLDENNEFEGKIYKLAHKFLYENKINTEDKDLDENLNIIIKAFPEFINIIGKKQHQTHQYTLDIHTLLVLANSINNPDYKNLPKINKLILKNAAIFHDISKTQNQVDKDHQCLSAVYSKSIIKKLIKNPETIERLSEFIKNHHWLSEYQTSKDKVESAKETAFKFRRSGDFDAAKIMTQADIMSVSEEFYDEHKDALKKENLAEIEENIKKFNSNGCAIFSDYFISPKSLDNFIQNYKGKDYKVIDFHKIAKDEDLSKYGFAPKRFKDNVNFLVHMVPCEESRQMLENVKRLASSTNEGCLSVSLINPNHARTYENRKYGVILSTINNNIINIDNENQGSGCKKGIAEAANLIFNDTEARENFKTAIMKTLGIKNVSDEEYREFYEKFLSQKTSMNFPDDKKHTLGGVEFDNRALKDAIIKFQNSLIDKSGRKHNEIVCYAPKIHAVIAKENSLAKVPDDVLDFAYKNKLPIVLI